MKYAFLSALVGVFFGFALGNIGFSSWDQVHAMFLFQDLRLLFTFGLAVMLMGLGWRLFGKRRIAVLPPRPIHPGIIPGGLLFGAGWAVSGACPSIALVQLGEGQLGAGLSLAGMFLGNWLYGVIHARYFSWSIGGCGD